MIIRNSLGHGVAAAAVFYGEGSNMNAECNALLDGLHLIISHGLGLSHIFIESDSQILVQMVLKKAAIPWKLQKKMEQIWGILNS